MSRLVLRSTVVLLFAVACLASCRREGPGHTDNDDADDTTGARSAAGAVDLGETSYRPGELRAVGSLTGRVRLEGAPPADTLLTETGEPACDASAEPNGPAAGDQSNTVVWIADPRVGKALPVERRAEITVERCALQPRVQTAVVGTGINILNEDRLIHKLVLTDAATGGVRAIMPFFNEGQIVASDRLAAAPGVVQIQCAVHPWMRAFVLVFDHPYYAVTSSDGTFRIDSLAPGAYTLMVWHEGAPRPVSRTVRVPAGGTATADLALRLEPVP